MSDRLRSYPVSVDPAMAPPAATTRLAQRRPEGSADGGGLSLETLLSRIHGLPALSPAVVRALQLSDKETIPAREIVDVINADGRFGSRVVKAANSPSFNLPRPITSVNDAMLLLGTSAIREVVLVAAARDIFFRSASGYGLGPKDMWAHSLACGIASEIVADAIGYHSRSEAFIGGLLHDVGKIVLNEEMQTAGPAVREHMAREDCTFVEAERAVLGYDHCDIGARVARAWSVPQHIVQAVMLHRKPVILRQTVPLAGLIHLGEILCSMAGIGLGFDGLGLTLDTQVMKDFKFTEEMSDAALSRLLDRLAASAGLFAPPAEAAPKPAVAA
ncbi:MAG TPA: HDOD domain-containing protein [Chthonomonadaceae bacterium]|nr:HDOD domain-containing protein [Chthonomonadaceae bacterium]